MKTWLTLACAVSVTLMTARVGMGANAPQQSSGSCQKNISFAVAVPSGVVQSVPKFAQKWIRGNAKRYPGVCFSQNVNQNTTNYLLVFASLQSAFVGFCPTVRTTTTTSTGLASGNGTVTDNYGNFWNYTYNGTTTTTTTNTTQENVPYVDTARTLYINAYDQEGKLVSSHSRTITTRQGGDPTSGAFYNVGALLKSRIDTRGRLLGAVVKDVSADNPKPLFSDPAYWTAPLTVQVQRVFGAMPPKYARMSEADKEEVVRRLNQRMSATARGQAEPARPSPYLGMYQPSKELQAKWKSEQAMRDAQAKLLSAQADVEQLRAQEMRETQAQPEPSAKAIMPRSATEADFPLTAVVTLVQRLGNKQYRVSAQIGNIDYVLQGPRLDPGHYQASFDYQGQDKIMTISAPDQNGVPAVFAYQIESEKAH